MQMQSRGVDSATHVHGAAVSSMIDLALNPTLVTVALSLANTIDITTTLALVNLYLFLYHFSLCKKMFPKLIVSE